MKGIQYLAAGFATAILLAWGPPASAHELAVPGYSPANPRAVVSIPNTTEVWRKLEATPLGATLQGLLAGDSAAEGPTGEAWLEQIEKAGNDLGFSLRPADLFVNTISGLDFYALRPDGRRASVTVLAFHEADVPGRILDHLKREVRQTSGSAGGFASDIFEEQEDAGRRLLELPAFSLYLAAEGNTLVMATEIDALESSAADQGRATFTSDFFRRHNEGVKEEPADIWFFGEPGLVLPVLLRGAINPDLFLADAEEQASTIARIAITPEAFKVATFVPYQDMEVTRQRFSRAAPPAGPLTVLETFPREGLFYYATNYFDGLEFVDHLLGSITAIPGTNVTKEQVEEQISTTTPLLGFDVQNDLLANLGPEMGILVTRLGEDETLPFWAQVEAVITVGVRDETRFAQVLEIFEDSATTPARPGREEIRFIKEASTEHGGYRYLDVPLLENMGLVPSYAMEGDDLFIVASNRQIMEEVLAIGTGTGRDPVTAAPSYQRIDQRLEPNRNNQYTISIPRLAQLLRNSPIIGEKAGPDSPAGQALMEILGALRTFTGTAIYKLDGRKNEYLIQM